MPVKTRWASLVSCLQSLIQNQTSLRKLAWSEDKYIIDKLGDLKLLILDFSFWNKIDQILNIVKPIAEWITRLEADKPYISDVFYALLDIKSIMINKLPEINFLSKEEKKSILLFFDNRKTMALHPIHYASAILDPRYQGRQLESNNDIEGVEYIFLVSKLLIPEETQNVMCELAQYRTHEGLWSKQFIWSLEIENVSPSTWWNGICGSSSLSKIASGILSLPSSSAATERSFSTYSLIHTKKRNKLTNERAGKLLYIHQNQNNLHKKQVQKKNSQNTEKSIQSDVSETHSIVNEFHMAPSTSTFNINQLSEKVEAEAEHEMNIISSCSEEDWDTDDLVDNSMDTESFSSRSDFEEVINT
ncbi:unnamed protein product [Macrosiphum euphorbiae]|uniref:HAT C-terminal dimerisation domain-containing protein n=1 Tax=Macrosiphum euphorbiae TaxID=13131 RepID=A0AAV0XSL1_9HEMI|nr:unnamed protein product [Macrosiphum euphorbiae]